MDKILKYNRYNIKVIEDSQFQLISPYFNLNYTIILPSISVHNQDNIDFINNDYFILLNPLEKTLFSNRLSNNSNSTTIRSNKIGKENLLHAFIDKNNNDEDNNSNLTNITPTITISTKLSNRLQLENNELVDLKLIKKSSTNLQRVVLLANDENSFLQSVENNVGNKVLKYLAKEEFRNYLVKNSTLFDQGSTLEIKSDTSTSYSFQTLECYPLFQGTISYSSTIIIIGPDDTTAQQQFKPNDENTNSNSNNSNIKLSTLTSSSPLRLSSFIIHPLNKSVELQQQHYQHHQLQHQQQTLFHYTPNSKCMLPSKNFLVSIKQLKPIPQNVNLESRVHSNYNYLSDGLVTISTLKKFNIFNGCWIKLENLLNNKQIAIRVFSIINNNSTTPLDLQDNYLYLPPLSIFNLGFDSKTSYLLSSTSSSTSISLNDQIQLELSPLKPILDSPNLPSPDFNNNNNNHQDSLNNFPIANRIKISRVNSRYSDGHASYSKQLLSYFSTKRIMKEGDVFLIAIGSLENSSNNEDEIVPTINNNNDLTTTIPTIVKDKHLIYFHVDSIIPNQTSTTPTLSSLGSSNNENSCNQQQQLYIIDNSETTLIQEGSTQSMIPNDITNFFNRNQDLTCVYEKEMKKIIDLILPFLQTDNSFDFNCTILVNGPKGVGKSSLLRQVSNYLGLHTYAIDCHELYDFTETKKEDNIRKILEKASNSIPCLLILENFEILEQTPQNMQQEKKESNISHILKETLKQINDKLSITNNNNIFKLNPKSGKSLGYTTTSSNYPLIIAATVNSTDDLTGKVRSWFKHEIILDAPDENQRLQILKTLFKDIPINNSISLKNIAIRTASFLYTQLKSLVQMSGINALKRIQKIQKDILPIEICNLGFSLILDDISNALSEMQGYQSSSIGAPKIPNVSWSDVGGLASVKSEIMDTIQLPLEHPHLFSSGIGKRSGILFYGPPGTGKTLLAKAIATECSLNFLSVKGPELINMYIGESEKNIREIFNKARQAKPCVIFFDELDSLAPSRGNGADSGGVMDRVVSQLLAELDGMQKSADVFIIGATNRPDLLDSALMRPGRLDRLLYLGISTDKESQFKIVQALTRKFHLSEDIDLRQVVEKCPMNLTGADFYALCSDSLANAMKDRISKLEKARIEGNGDQEEEDFNQKLIIEQKHFLQAVDSLVPSVSMDELEYYHKVQKQFSTNKN
eukprot:gene4855-6051_t